MDAFEQLFVQANSPSEKLRLADARISELLARNDDDCRQVFLACREALRFESRWKDLPGTLSGPITRAGIQLTSATHNLVVTKYVGVAIAMRKIVNLYVAQELTYSKAARRLDGLALGFLAFWMEL